MQGVFTERRCKMAWSRGCGLCQQKWRSHLYKSENHVNTILYSVIDKVKDSKITLKVNGKEYSLGGDVLLYIDGEKKDINKITAGLYGKVVLKKRKSDIARFGLVQQVRSHSEKCRRQIYKIL